MSIANSTFDIPAKDPYLNKKSLEFGFRAKRFAVIKNIIQEILDEKGHCHILDLGGSEKYWKIGEDFIKANRDRLHFTIINPEQQKSQDTSLFSFYIGDATSVNLFRGKTFDFVHSNSVIEHVGDFSQIRRFAENTARLAPRYYMQTPNFWFPYEPHFRFPGFQWLPASMRAWLMTKLPLGFFSKQDCYLDAREHVDSIRLLTTRQIRALFPGATIAKERVLGLPKSILAWR